MNAIPPFSDDQVWRQMLAYLDGSLSSDEVRLLNDRLKGDPQLREIFSDLLLQQIKLKELAEEKVAVAEEAADVEAACEVENVVPLMAPRRLLTEMVMARAARRAAWRRRMQRVKNGFRNSPVTSVLASAACLALLGVLIWSFLLPTRLAELAMADPGVLIERGHVKLNATVGMTLRQGDRILTPENGRARFVYDREATDVTVQPATELGLELVHASKQLNLGKGALEADVAKQDPAHPLGLVTPEAEAIVVGTRFKLSTEQGATRLEVFEGAVRILQSFEGPSMLVPEGHFVRVQPGRPANLLPIPAETGGVTLEVWSQDPAAGTNVVTLNQLKISGVGVAPGGSRVRGFLHPPLPGAYIFQLNANGPLSLWVSDSEDPEGLRKVGETAGNTPSAESGLTVPMQAGHRYYFELRGGRVDQPMEATVSWVMPGGKHRVVYGEFLSPFSNP